jgi:hypothetical protein
MVEECSASPPMKRSLASLQEELKELHLLCRNGRIYDAEQWIQQGKPLQLDPVATPKGRQPTSALRIALETGQHSLALLLLRNGYRLELEPSSLDIALKSRRWDLFELLLEWGADLKSVSTYVLLDTYSTEL